ncbi:MAG: alanine racemase [Bacteroidaceae bacterium]|nr:alanine racemase [Bacteroidaceae bacterium]
MRITTVASLVGAQLAGESDMDIEWLLTDSRSLCFPETTLFFAIRTSCGDGHRYVRDLYESGVRAFVVDNMLDGIPDAVQLIVHDTLTALQRLAERHRESYDIPVIGITGSNGKTVVKEWLYQMLSPDMTVTRSPRSYNSQIGVPLSVWRLTENSDIAIFEAGISRPGEMDALQRIIQPTIGVFTGLGPAHQENFTSMEQKRGEKMRLFKDCPVVFKAGEGGDAIQMNRDLCAEVCRHLGMAEDVIQERLARLEPVAMRLEVKQGRHGCTLVNDTYNSDLGSLDIALDFMNRRPERRNRQRVLILSDILQSGVPAHELYSHVARLVENRGVERLIGIGAEISACASCFDDTRAECSFFSGTDDFMQSTEFTSLRDSMVLVKGARVFHFDTITDALEQKVHETILEVNLGAVIENLNYYRSFLKPETRIICMVKADAYGTGAVEVAKTLQSQQQVGYLAVAVADEGALLRSCGITKNIMVMNPEMGAINTLFEYNLEPEVYSFRMLDALVHAAEREGITAMPIHIKLDTGMHRLGFDPMKDMPALVQRLRSQSALIPRSVFSHFVGSDSDMFDDFSAEQYRRYLHGADALQAAFPHYILRHICNSAGIEHFPERQMDMVRLGLGLYGINPRDNALLHNVSTLKTTILQIHDVPASETVGYSRRGLLHRDSRIAAIPIGYADGWNRLFGCGSAYCLVHGQRAPYVGNICMDVCMIDVTDIPQAQEGDQVIMFGEELSPSVLAGIADTIPYEILTSVSSRVKRVYYHE